jgi:hypothetical protein
MCKYLEYCKDIIYNSPLLPSITQGAITGFHVYHDDAHRAVMKFFRLFFKVGIPGMVYKASPEISIYSSCISKVLSQNELGAKLIGAIVTAITSQAPSSHVQDVAEVLDCALQFNLDSFGSLLRNSLGLLPVELSSYCEKFYHHVMSQKSIRSRISAVLELHRCSKALYS